MAELIYVSWGGTGRGAALRAAYEEAATADLDLVYLAILDPPTFADLDGALLELVADELEWLLRAHLRTVAEASSAKLNSRVVVRTGEVDDEVEALVRDIDAATVVIGAPVATGQRDIDELVDALRARTGIDVHMVDPEAPPLT